MTSKILLIISCFSFGCVSPNKNNYVQARPKNLPDSSFWIGGVDGGNWYYIRSINNHRNMARIAVYNDQDSSLIVDTTFMLICNADKYTFIHDLKQQISAFDGEKIYFIQSDSVNCYLQPVK